MERKPHIVVVPNDAQGHISPMMHLCGYLVHNGFSITMVISAKSYELIKLKGTWPPPGLDITLKILHNERPYPKLTFENGRYDLTTRNEYKRTNKGPLEELIKALGSTLCLICDYQCSWAVDAAQNLDIPTAVLFTGSAIWSWFEYNMPQLVSSGLVPMRDSDELPEKEDYRVLENPVVLRSQVPWHYWNDQRWQNFVIKYNSTVFDKANWILVNSCEELEPEMINYMKATFGRKYLPTGPLFLLNKEPSNVGFKSFDNECLQWLDTQPHSSVLYISFGSLAQLTYGQLKEFATGLELSEQRFLWVMRPEWGLHGTKVDDETQVFYEEFSRANKDRGMIVSWAPQIEVLNHPSVGGFLSHCGWNSTIEGIMHGKVIICWPCLFDQNTNSKLIQDLGVGIELGRGVRVPIDKMEVERVLRMVMEGEEGRRMRKRAQKVSMEARKSGSSYKNLQAFVDELSLLLGMSNAI